MRVVYWVNVSEISSTSSSVYPRYTAVVSTLQYVQMTRQSVDSNT